MGGPLPAVLGRGWARDDRMGYPSAARGRDAESTEEPQRARRRDGWVAGGPLLAVLGRPESTLGSLATPRMELNCAQMLAVETEHHAVARTVHDDTDIPRAQSRNADLRTGLTMADDDK